MKNFDTSSVSGIFNQEVNDAVLKKMSQKRGHKFPEAEVFEEDFAVPEQHEVYNPITGLQNFLITNRQAADFATISITLSAFRGKKPFRVGQIVELIPESQEAIQGKIVKAEPETDKHKFILTIERYSKQ